METYIFVGLFLFICLILFFLFQAPKKELKTKAQKQEQLIASYREKLRKELSHYNQNPTLKSQKKVELLKSFARELQFNIFFDDEEVRKIIKNLAQEEI